MEIKTIRKIVFRDLAGLFMLGILTACSGSGGGDGGGNTNPHPYPSSADDFEGVAGDDTVATASSISIGQTQDRTLYPIGDVDYIAVDLTAGLDYEFSAFDLCLLCDTTMYLFDTDGTTLISFNDDWVGWDSTIQFTPTVTGTYYLRVRARSSPITDPYKVSPGVATYKFAARDLVDVDGDGYSDFHDCDDNDGTIYPWAAEIAGDSIDQNCSGVDQLASTTDDGISDNDAGSAQVFAETVENPWDIITLSSIFIQNARTISPSGDIDYFKFTLAPHEGGYIEFSENYVFRMTYTIYDSDGITMLPKSARVINDTGSAKTFYIAFETLDGTSTGYYVPVWFSSGVDADGDGYWTVDFADVRDCNDADANVNPAGTDSTVDGIDQNCNGTDGS